MRERERERERDRERKETCIGEERSLGPYNPEQWEYYLFNYIVLPLPK
jgi:hypothetical protein